MFRPESDWTGQDAPGVEHFAIDHRFSVSDVDVDIRQFDWVARCEGPLSPARHYLDFSLTAVTRGSQLSVDAWKEVRNAGEILYLPPDFAYWGKPALQPRRLLCIAIGDQFIESIFETERPFCDLLPCADVQSVALRRMLNAIVDELTSPGFASATLLESMLVGVAVELARYSGNRDVSTATRNRGSDRQVRKITDYVMANLSQRLSIAEIARECGMSERHVARVFKDGTGVSIGDYIARSRVALAKELLAADDLRVKEISWRCGFRSTSAFSAAFRAATKMSPRDYRHGGALAQ